MANHVHIDPAGFTTQAADHQTSAENVRAYARPDAEHVDAVLASYGPGAGPHLARALATHYKRRQESGKRLADSHDTSVDLLNGASTYFDRVESDNTAGVTLT